MIDFIKMINLKKSKKKIHSVMARRRKDFKEGDVVVILQGVKHPYNRVVPGLVTRVDKVFAAINKEDNQYWIRYPFAQQVVYLKKQHLRYANKVERFQYEMSREPFVTDEEWIGQRI